MEGGHRPWQCRCCQAQPCAKRAVPLIENRSSRAKTNPNACCWAIWHSRGLGFCQGSRIAWGDGDVQVWTIIQSSFWKSFHQKLRYNSLSLGDHAEPHI